MASSHITYRHYARTLRDKETRSWGGGKGECETRKRPSILPMQKHTQLSLASKGWLGSSAAAQARLHSSFRRCLWESRILSHRACRKAVIVPGPGLYLYLYLYISLSLPPCVSVSLLPCLSLHIRLNYRVNKVRLQHPLIRGSCMRSPVRGNLAVEVSGLVVESKRLALRAKGTYSISQKAGTSLSSCP